MNKACRNKTDRARSSTTVLAIALKLGGLDLRSSKCLLVREKNWPRPPRLGRFSQNGSHIILYDPVQENRAGGGGKFFSYLRILQVLWWPMIKFETDGIIELHARSVSFLHIIIQLRN